MAKGEIYALNVNVALVGCAIAFLTSISLSNGK
jgi:hypothetical protein